MKMADVRMRKMQARRGAKLGFAKGIVAGLLKSRLEYYMSRLIMAYLAAHKGEFLCYTRKAIHLKTSPYATDPLNLKF
jgi:hypothetical protein